MLRKRFFMVAFTGMIFFWIGCQAPQTAQAPAVNGEELVRNLWSDFEKSDRQIFENWVAEGFQSVHQNGARDRAAEIKLLMDLNLGEYTLDNFTTTQNEDMAVVTYTVAATETIAGKVLPKSPAVRLSVFRYDGKAWKWIAHANLNPMD